MVDEYIIILSILTIIGLFSYRHWLLKYSSEWYEQFKIAWNGGKQNENENE